MKKETVVFEKLFSKSSTDRGDPTISTTYSICSKLLAICSLSLSDALVVEILVELDNSMVPIPDECASGRLAELADYQLSYAYQVTKESV